MAKGGKMTKLKSVIKRWQSIGKSGTRANGSAIAAAIPSDDEENEYISSSHHHHQGMGRSLQAVYVGKSRRRYLISSDIIDHPLVRELVDRSDGSDSITVGCEVVLFEHLLWMLENADPQPESLEELVEYYAC